MAHAGGNAEELAGLQDDRARVIEIDLKLAFQDEKAFIRSRVVMLAMLTRHDCNPDAVPVDLEERERTRDGGDHPRARIVGLASACRRDERSISRIRREFPPLAGHLEHRSNGQRHLRR